MKDPVLSEIETLWVLHTLLWLLSCKQGNPCLAERTKAQNYFHLFGELSKLEKRGKFRLPVILE